MMSTTYRLLPVFLLATSLVFAQDGRGRPAAMQGGQSAGEYAGARPPEDASQDEKRAFYQKRAAERARAVESSPPALPATGHQHGGEPDKAASARLGKNIQTDSTRASNRAGGADMRESGGAIWLSDSPPARGDAAPGGGMAGMAMGGERQGAPKKRLWLRSGNYPQTSPFYHQAADAPPEIILASPQGKADGDRLPALEEGRKNITFEMPAQGFYRVYVTTRKLEGEVLNISVAKAEVSNFTHDADGDERASASAGIRVLESAPIELVRERKPNESPFFRLLSGTNQAFIVLQKGLPMAGARVRFVSHQGWSKEATSDEQGRVSFQILRDYFPPWSEFQRRFKATFLLIADVDAAEAGSYKNKPYSSVRYQATLSGSYYPSPEDYRSYAWGLGVSLLIVLFCAVVVYLYRRRRVRPFREVRFDDAE